MFANVEPLTFWTLSYSVERVLLYGVLVETLAMQLVDNGISAEMTVEVCL